MQQNQLAIASLVASVLAFIFAIAGIVATGVPAAGMIFSFGSPVLGLVGIITGGMAISQASNMGQSSGLATAGLVLGIISFLLGLLVALTCGLCNMACTSASQLQPRNFPPIQTQSPLAPLTNPLPNTQPAQGSPQPEWNTMIMVHTMTDQMACAMPNASGTCADPAICAAFCQLDQATQDAFLAPCAMGNLTSCFVVTEVREPEPLAALGEAGFTPDQCRQASAGETSLVYCQRADQTLQLTSVGAP